MAEEGTIIELPPVLHLPSPNDGSLHPYAAKTYLEFLAEVLKKAPGRYLASEDDLRLLLSDTEYARLEACENEIKAWLQKCSVDNDQATLDIYPYHSPFNAMWDMKKLITKVAERAVLKERRIAALNEISPPFDDAEKYLSDKEYERFRESLRGVADAYLDGGKGCVFNDWRFDTRAGDYLLWTGIIEERKEKETRRKQAEAEHDRYLMEINGAIKKFRESLKGRKKPSFAYPLPLAPYKPHLWCQPEVSADGVKEWVRQNVRKKLPPLLRDFVSYDMSWEMLALPYGSYVDCGVPCIRWDFKVLLLAQACLRLVEKTFTKGFHGYEYSMTVKAEEIGHLYLGPVEWDEQEGFTTPIALLSLLAEGKLESDGIEIIEHSGTATAFHIRGYDDGSVEVEEPFRKFIIDAANEKGLAQGLLARGVIDELSAHLVGEKAKLPLPQLVGAQASAEKTIDGEVIAALEGMGYKKEEIKAGMEATDLSTAASLEQKLVGILKNIGT